MQDKNEQLKPNIEQRIGSRLGKEYVKAIYCHPAYLTNMQSTSCEMPGWMKHKLEIEIARRNMNNLRYADDTTLMAESKEELRSLLINVKEKSEKIDLKLNILKIKIIASSLITSWQIDGEIVATWQTLFWEAPKSLQVVTAAMKLKDAYSLVSIA